MPKTLSVSKGVNWLELTTTSVKCNDIHYLFPTKEQLASLWSWPSFTVVTALDLESYTADTNIIFGQPSQIHMSQNSLYLAQWVYMPQQFSCPPNARCAESMFWGGQQHTLIHGFDLRWSAWLDYMGSNLIQWSPLGDQYSMDEHKGNFRILTQTWNNQSATHLYVLDFFQQERKCEFLCAIHNK
jgi:hypothetical protein